jgi:chromosome segregation ATPase
MTVATQEMATAERIKTAAEKKVRTLKKEKKNLEKIIKSLETQMKTLTTSHDTDVKKTKARVAAHQDTIKALRIIIRDLGDISRKYPTGKTTLFELKEVVGKISQISKKNPLLALMELSTTFNPATLNTVISKLNAIKEKMAASVADDLEDQKLASAYFQRLYSSLDKSKTASDSRLDEVMVEFRSEQAKAVQATEDFNEAVADRNRARSLLSKKMFEFTAAKNAYTKDLAGV